jgi:hypothetical protein
MIDTVAARKFLFPTHKKARKIAGFLVFRDCQSSIKNRSADTLYFGTRIGGGGGKPGGAGGCHRRHPWTRRLPETIITITRNMRTFFIAAPFFSCTLLIGQALLPLNPV